MSLTWSNHTHDPMLLQRTCPKIQTLCRAATAPWFILSNFLQLLCYFIICCNSDCWCFLEMEKTRGAAAAGGIDAIPDTTKPCLVFNLTPRDRYSENTFSLQMYLLFCSVTRVKCGTWSSKHCNLTPIQILHHISVASCTTERWLYEASCRFNAIDSNRDKF